MRRKHIGWITAGGLSLVLSYVLSKAPGIAESVYGHAIYPIIRWILSHSISLLPLPGVTVLFAICLWWFWRTALLALRRKTWNYKTLIGGILGTIGALVCLFQFLWGFNYCRPAWDSRVGVVTKGMLAQELVEEYTRATDDLRGALEVIPSFDTLNMLGQRDYERTLAPLLREVLSQYQFPLSSTPRVRIVRPKGILMRWNTAGIYLPYSGESHIDAGMLPVQLPFTVAHEMAHGFGVTDEGDCNFLAYLACERSTDPYFKCAGRLVYWRYVASEYRHQFPKEYDAQFDSLPPLLITTLKAIHANDALYPDLFPKFRNAVYDTYLRSQGVPEGLQSYNRVVQLVHAYRKL